MAAVVDYIGETQGSVRLPGVMMLGYVAAHSESLALAVILSKVMQYQYLLNWINVVTSHLCCENPPTCGRTSTAIEDLITVPNLSKHNTTTVSCYCVA